VCSELRARIQKNLEGKAREVLIGLVPAELNVTQLEGPARTLAAEPEWPLHLRRGPFS
jgi:hypothetical protein